MTLKEELKEALLEIKSDEDLQIHKQLFVATIKSDIKTSHLADEINGTTSLKELLSVYAKIRGYN